ncbi:MAG: Nif3-like dinuclear metal center hexameric protein [Bacteroidales bacterium]|nr:Nif3-like dinuclear metal center hexameric protein [Bacteroidales bacterium]
MRASEICAAIEQFAPLSIQESWDNSGLIVGSPSDEVSGVLVGFDCTPALVDEAVSLGVNMIITHHPLIFKGIRHISEDEPVGEALIKAIRAGILVYAAHTTADKVLAGVSGAMAAKLGLKEVEVLDESGLGAIGNIPAPLSYAASIDLLKRAFGCKVVRASADPLVKISRVAVCGGSGAEFIDTARLKGAQLYVSADISYHRFFTPRGFAVADIGHFESEVEIVDILLSVVRKNFPNFAAYACAHKENPVKYY